MTIEFYVFRHGETDWNLQKRFQGHTDIPLNDKGRKEADKLGIRLKGLGLQILLSSDLSRAFETASIANEYLQIPIRKSSSLREVSFGELEGLHRNDVHYQFGEEHMRLWYSTHPDTFEMRFPGGESKSEVLTRMQNYLIQFCREEPHYTRIGVSTHGGSLRRLVHACEDAPIDPVPIPNTCLYKILFDPKNSRWLWTSSGTEINFTK